MAIKKVWIVCGMDGFPVSNPKALEPVEFSTSKAAITRAKVHIKTTENCEAWVFALSHVVSRPEIDAIVEEVK